MRRYKIHTETTSIYFCTSTIVKWQYVLKKETYFRAIIDSLNYCRREKGLLLFGLVIMPNHIHFIVSSREGFCLSNIIRDFKRHTSTRIAELLIEDNEKQFLYIFQREGKKYQSELKIWQNDYHPVAILSDKWFYEKMAYIHNNPVRKGFVTRPEHWKYSSARNWISNDHGVIPLDLTYL